MAMALQVISMSISHLYDPILTYNTQISTFLQQYLSSKLHSAPDKTDPIRIGFLSTAMINPAAIIRPVETHPEAVITAAASRDLESAQKYAKKYGFEKAYGSYQELLDDPDIDAVYIPLPNGMHCGKEIFSHAFPGVAFNWRDRMGHAGIEGWKACPP